MNNAEHEPIITKADPLPFVVQRPNKDAETVAYRPAEKLAERPIEFSTWELITLKIDATLQATKFIAGLTPHIVSTFIGFMTMNGKQIATALASLVCGLLAYWGVPADFQIPLISQPLNVFIAEVFMFVGGLVLPALFGGKKDEQP